MSKDRIALIRGFRATAPDPKIVEAKARFEEINAYVTEAGGWVTSVPGAPEVTVECLPDSALPDDLRGLGYDVREVGGGERILAHQIIERFVRRADGGLSPLTEGSTATVVETRSHAGITMVKRYAFEMP